MINILQAYFQCCLLILPSELKSWLHHYIYNCLVNVQLNKPDHKKNKEIDRKQENKYRKTFHNIPIFFLLVSYTHTQRVLNPQHHPQPIQCGGRCHLRQSLLDTICMNFNIKK